ncbi:B3 domain-containing protein family [Quillaja saponaria]|uniref:B3 domain-containing protein family n=1 Tax=Quillaja saponaria TaxID=32244 RepID=A0AAD7L2V4_QUISA|nr:B3 domain-containing protein family [Quillaja saponaria]
MEFIRFCASKKTQNDNLSSLKAKRTAGFTLPVGLIPRKKRSVTLRKRSEIVGRSVPDFEEFHFRALNKSRKRCFTNQEKYKERETTIASPMKKKQRRIIDLEYQPELPVEFRNKIEELGGSNIKLVIQKELFGTDLNPNNGRFSIPQTQILAEFLNESEMAFLDQRQRNNQGRLCGLDVLVLDPRLVEFNLHLKKWKMETTDVYNLTYKWNEILNGNRKNLCLHDVMQLWSFRRSNTNQLCFALVKV